MFDDPELERQLRAFGKTLQREVGEPIEGPAAANLSSVTTADPGADDEPSRFGGSRRWAAAAAVVLVVGGLAVLAAVRGGGAPDPTPASQPDVEASTSTPLDTSASTDVDTSVVSTATDITSPPTVDPGAVIEADEVVEIDFFGVLASADVSDWQNLDERGDPIGPGAATTGGPESSHYVGPGRMLLANGTAIDVLPATPGGNFCRLLGGDAAGQPSRSECFVVGAFRPGTSEAAWFSTHWAEVVAPDSYQLNVIALAERSALISAGGESYFRLPVSETSTLIGCEGGDLSSTPIVPPKAGALFATVGADQEIHAITCASD